nr:alpha/beta hydrolase [Candidatus Sigynarchaeota archaeon]
MGVLSIRPKTLPFKDGSGNVLAGSVASLEKLSIGGIEQWILARGRDVTKPLLLFLHGGPGVAEMYIQPRFNRALED